MTVTEVYKGPDRDRHAVIHAHATVGLCVYFVFRSIANLVPNVLHKARRRFFGVFLAVDIGKMGFQFDHPS